MWLGEADPVTSMEMAREEDPELNAIREVFANWSEHLGCNISYTTSKVIKAACTKERDGFEWGSFTHPEFREVLLRVAGEGGVVSGLRLGKWLSKISGRVVGGLRLSMTADPSNGNRFRLERPPSHTPEDPDDCPF